MKRSIKNIIMLMIIVLVCGGIFFTVKKANESQQIPTSQNEGTPPSKPEGDSNTNMSEPPTKPDNDSNTENMQTKEQMPENNMAQNITTKIDTKYYVIFALEGVIISSLIGYLILSQFNKKTFKETFVNADKIVIILLIVILLTAIITFIGGKVSEKNINNSEQSTMSFEQGEPQNNSQSNNINYSASKEITESTEISNSTFTSSEKDENSVLVNGDIDVTLSDIKVNKTGDSDGGDNSNFYGNNSAILAKDGANLNLSNIEVTTDASGANGVFSYGGSATTNNSSSDGTTVNISDSKITTTGDNAGGIMTTGGGTTNASNLTINTAGTSSAAIRTDRGGGKVTVKGGTYTTTGQGSPTIYSTAEINVSNATLVAKASEGIVIEGKNSVSIDNCNLTDSNTKLNGQSTTYKNIFLYQSMSGDAENGNAEFSAKNSTITTNNGDTLYVTNTTATINLENNNIVNNDNNGNFLRIQKDSWGKSGSNGGDVTLNLTNQKATGNIVVDSISTLNMTLKSASYYEGTINSDNSAESIKLTLDSSSKIKLTGDSYITSLDDEDSSYSNIDFNGYKLYVNGVEIN